MKYIFHLGYLLMKCSGTVKRTVGFNGIFFYWYMRKGKIEGLILLIFYLIDHLFKKT